MQRPANSGTLTKDPLPSVQLEPTETDKDSAANLIAFEPTQVAPRTAPQKVPRVQQPAPRVPPGPGTPRKKKEKAVGDVATETMATLGSSSPQRSPVKLANGRAASVCHSMVGDIGPSYFTAKRLAMQNHPKNCSGCTKKLLPGSGKPSDKIEGITRVGSKREVLICQNALNHRDHECVHCLCFDCHSVESASKVRPKRKRSVNSTPRSESKKKLKSGSK